MTRRALRDQLAGLLIGEGYGSSDAYDAADAALAALPAVDEASTQKLPPIRETVLRRPPPPQVRELKGAELLLALAAELKRDTDPSVTGDESGSDQ